MTTVTPRITLIFVNQTYYIKLLTAIDLDVRCLSIKEIRNLNTIVNHIRIEYINFNSCMCVDIFKINFRVGVKIFIFIFIFFVAESNL